MKGILIAFLIFDISIVFAENTIIAVVNNSPITLNSIKIKTLNINSNESILDEVNRKIDIILQLEKLEELGIEVSLNDINQAILDISVKNNITLEQLKSYPEFLALEKKVTEKISILNLQRLITKDINIPEDEVIKICSKEGAEKSIKEIKIAQIIVSKVEMHTKSDQDLAIKLFLNKLSEHIKKGASFEAFAKLHSQHPSYVNGGLTDWIEVNNPSTMMLDSLKDNEISQIYLTDFGFAIGIKIDERFVSSNLKKCKEELIYLNAEEFYSNWVKDLREDAYIKIYHDKL
tara:strand:+ start:475 stop:1344 length:870 start_codon:yes stop_codon:yes gene_type:complete